MGAWIEMASKLLTNPNIMSHPSWVRGLKLTLNNLLENIRVAPFVGAWIEILLTFCFEESLRVAPFVGAWIEILFYHLYHFQKSVAPFVGAWIEIVVSS